MNHIFLWFELFCLVVAVVNYRTLKGSNLFWFIPFLVLTNVQEWGSRYGFLSQNGNNILSQNIFTTIEFMFYTWLFSKEVHHLFLSKMIRISGSILILAILINLLFFQGIAPEFHSYTYLPGSILMILFAAALFFNNFLGEEYVDIPRTPMFWISIGVMFFYAGMFSLYTMLLPAIKSGDYSFVNLYLILTNVFNIILYSCFIISFLCLRGRKLAT
ncbi:hypothetical protein [Pollutibacter soli]|uniref:hypothetical protein n=1 Tax=Pollutibacter soli TaxID=3034157 RepID=UPI0030134955